MLIPLILFWILLIWGLCAGDLYGKEAACYGAFWAVMLAGLIFLPDYITWFIIGLVLVDVVLLMKVLGQYINLR